MARCDSRETRDASAQGCRDNSKKRLLPRGRRPARSRWQLTRQSQNTRRGDRRRLTGASEAEPTEMAAAEEVAETSTEEAATEDAPTAESATEEAAEDKKS